MAIQDQGDSSGLAWNHFQQCQLMIAVVRHAARHTAKSIHIGLGTGPLTTDISRENIEAKYWLEKKWLKCKFAYSENFAF